MIEQAPLRKLNNFQIYSRKKSSSFHYFSLFLFFLLINTGCSVVMAVTGKKDPNLGVIRVGSTRGEVELQLGTPISSVTTENGIRTDIYEYEIGKEPSAGRAIAHGVMDILTWGIWEVIGTPVEALKGSKYQMTINYDSDNRVLSINQPVTFTPSRKEESASATQRTQQKAEALPSNIEIEGKLDQIKILKEKGKITEEEYAIMRKNILDNVSQDKKSSPKTDDILPPKLPY